MTTSLLISLSLLVSAPTPTTLDEDACIQRVLQKHADLRVADLQIESARTKLKELESTFYPKLQVTTWVAPMFRVNGNALEPTVDYQYESLSDWGPYLHFEARLVQILSTFGRFDTLKEAAELNTKVEEAKRQLVETSLLTETRRLILAYRLAVSLEKTVGTILETLDKALEYAKPVYAEGTGAITTIDLSRLEFGKSKALGFQAMLEEQTLLVEQGLRFLLHAHDQEELSFSFEKLPRLRSIEALPSTDTLIERAIEAAQSGHSSVTDSGPIKIWLRSSVRISTFPIYFWPVSSAPTGPRCVTIVRTPTTSTLTTAPGVVWPWAFAGISIGPALQLGARAGSSSEASSKRLKSSSPLGLRPRFSRWSPR